MSRVPDTWAALSLTLDATSPPRGEGVMTTTIAETAHFRPDGIQGHAIFSPDRRYRYTLSRLWGHGPTLTFILLNPSTADALNDDPTIRRCMRYAEREGYTGVVILNLFALRSTDPRALLDAVRDCADPIGPDNRVMLQGMCVRRQVVAAWGTHASHRLLRGQADWTRTMLAARQPSGYGALCFGRTADGSPKHPLYLRSDAMLEAYT
jgi:hypothetical protein